MALPEWTREDAKCLSLASRSVYESPACRGWQVHSRTSRTKALSDVAFEHEGGCRWCRRSLLFQRRSVSLLSRSASNEPIPCWMSPYGAHIDFSQGDCSRYYLGMRLYSLLTLWVFIAVLASPISSRADDRIAIGVSTILTGDGSTYGEDIKNVLLFANDKIGHGRFRLVIEDDKCNPKDAVSVAKKLTSSDRVQGVVGYGCSGALLGAAPVLDRLGIPTIGTVVSSAKISQAGPYVFRTHPSDEVGVQVLMSRLQKEHRTFGVLSAQTDFCQGILEGLQKLPRSNDLVIYAEDALPSDPDFKPALLRLRSKKIDGLFLNAQDEGGAYRMLKQAREIGLNVPFYTFYLGASAAFFSLAGGDAEGVVTVDTPSLEEISTPDGKRLFEEFIERYGPMKSWNYSFATTFEGFRALSQALLYTGDPIEYLRKTEFNGIFGPYSFDEHGDIRGISQVLKINQGGRAVTVH